MDRSVNIITGLAADNLSKSLQLLFFWFRQERGPLNWYSLKEVIFLKLIKRLGDCVFDMFPVLTNSVNVAVF